MLDKLSCPHVRDLAVRVNSVSSGLAEEDLKEVFKANRLPDTIMLPKVESKQEIQWVSKTSLDMVLQGGKIYLKKFEKLQWNL